MSCGQFSKILCASCAIILYSYNVLYIWKHMLQAFMVSSYFAICLVTTLCHDTMSHGRMDSRIKSSAHFSKDKQQTFSRLHCSACLLHNSVQMDTVRKIFLHVQQIMCMYSIHTCIWSGVSYLPLVHKGPPKVDTVTATQKI